MNLFNTIFSLLLVALLHTTVASDLPVEDQLSPAIQEWSIACDHWDYSKLETSAATFKLISQNTPNSSLALYWHGVAEFHLLLHLLGYPDDKSKQKKAQEALSLCSELFKRLIKLSPKHSEGNMILATLYGMDIANNPIGALWMGPAVVSRQKQSLQQGPDNPRSHYLLGMSYFYAGEMMGSREDGLNLLLKAEKLFDLESTSPQTPTQPRWGHSHCLTYIGKTYLALKKIPEAKAYFEKALHLNPLDPLAQQELHNLNNASTQIKP